MARNGRRGKNLVGNQGSATGDLPATLLADHTTSGQTVMGSLKAAVHSGGATGSSTAVGWQ